MKSKIDFDAEDVALPSFSPKECASWLTAVARTHGREVGRLSYRFCSDPCILRSNREFLGHDYYTDIITFDYSSAEVVSGDVLISTDTVRSNAMEYGVAFSRELARVVAHGLLHLCGIDDKKPGEREIMERHEDAALALLPENVFPDTDAV